MKEIELKNRKYGMVMLLVVIALFLAAIPAMVIGGIQLDEGRSPALFLCGFACLVLAPILIAGLKILKPQEALVLTLFGKYIGTLKGEGFYFVNPFCTSVNPAA